MKVGNKMAAQNNLKAVEGSSASPASPENADGFFGNLSQESSRALDEIKFTSAYPRGVTLFAEQGSPKGVFILRKGRAKLSMSSSDGKSVILRIATAGDILGLHAVISDEPYQASAETLEPCEVEFVRRADFLRFLLENPQASLGAAQQLSENYHVACEQIRAIGLTHSAMGKLAGFLLLSATNGRATDQGTRVFLALTHEEIGQMIGLTRETVTRTMGYFRRRQLVSNRGAAVVIQNKNALEQFAGIQ